jgi:hypothetical protein
MLLFWPLIAQFSGPDLPPGAIPAERYTMRYVAPPPGITFMIRTYQPPADRHFFLETVLPQNGQFVPRLHPHLVPPR